MTNYRQILKKLKYLKIQCQFIFLSLTLIEYYLLEMDITLLKVLTIVAQNGYKTEVKNSRHISSIFLKDEDLWTTLANYQYNKYSSLLSLAICKAIESKNTAKAIKLISRIAPYVSKDEEKNNPNKTFYKFKRYQFSWRPYRIRN